MEQDVQPDVQRSRADHITAWLKGAMDLRAQAAVQSLRGEVAALKGSLADRDEQIKRWSKEAAAAREAFEQGSGSARERADQASTPCPSAH